MGAWGFVIIDCGGFLRKKKGKKLLLKINPHADSPTALVEKGEILFTQLDTRLTDLDHFVPLNVSRPFFVRLLESGKIPFHKVGSHRRVYFRDLQAFKAKMDKTSDEALEELAKQAQQYDMGY